MTYNSELHHRSTIRLKNYDYSKNGAYFVTVCVRNKECVLGNIINGKMVLSETGKIVSEYWFEIPKHFHNVKLDEFCVMPNHIHGILLLNNVGVQNFEPLRNKFQHIIPKSIGSIIRTYKTAVTHWCKQNDYNFFWQRNYYEHIIRNENELSEISEYIFNNPLKWELDNENPENIAK
jgi:REP element-mobilizing transposase RayT